MLNCSEQISATQKAEHFFQNLFSHCWPYKPKCYPLLRRLIGFLKAPVFVSPSSHLHGHSLRQKGLGVWGRNKHQRGRNLKCRNNDSRQNTTSFRPPPYSLLKCFMDRRKEQPPPPTTNLAPKPVQRLLQSVREGQEEEEGPLKLQSWLCFCLRCFK